MPDMNDQQRELMEKLKNMSPEELKEFQKKQCIFCQIIDGKMEGKKIYEDEVSIGILDINPASAGHILLLPKEHYSIMPQIPDEEIKHLGIVSKKLSLAILKGLKVQGTTIFIANGLAAGQRAQHFMIHIIPRKEGDKVGIFIPQQQIKEEDLHKLHEVVQNKVNEIFGIKREVIREKKVKEEAPEKEETNEEKEEPKVEEETKEEEQEETKTVEKPKKEKKKKSKKKKRKKKKKEESASLDDIAGLFS